MNFQQMAMMQQALQKYVGKRVRLISMAPSPMEKHPIESGAMGTIYHAGGDVLNVKWDNGRQLGLVVGEDSYEIID